MSTELLLSPEFQLEDPDFRDLIFLFLSKIPSLAQVPQLTYKVYCLRKGRFLIRGPTVLYICSVLFS
jgi:hypothetical protein